MPVYDTHDSLYDAYYTKIATFSGWHANDKIDDEDYQPTANAHKGFYFIFPSVNPEAGMTSHLELTQAHFEIKVLYYYGSSKALSVNEKEFWAFVDATQKALYAFAGVRGDVLQFENALKKEKPNYFKMLILSGVLKYKWSMQ